MYGRSPRAVHAGAWPPGDNGLPGRVAAGERVSPFTLIAVPGLLVPPHGYIHDGLESQAFEADGGRLEGADVQTHVAAPRASIPTAADSAAFRRVLQPSLSCGIVGLVASQGRAGFPRDGRSKTDRRDLSKKETK
jgi:hypothetical protein